MSDDPADQGLSAAQIAQQIDASERRHPGPRRRPVTEPTLAPGAQPGVQHR